MTGPIARTTLGALQGDIEENGVRVWRGVPYAAPITQSGRFLEAQAVRPWVGTRDATEFGPVAPQPSLIPIGKSEPMSEDCLFLNIWSPAGADRLPVLVWIHGGAYVTGAGSNALYQGDTLAALGPAVVVTINYRMGYLGFLDLSGLAGAEGRFQPNLGLRDQITALEWVREHISAFGGDPGNVTIFGESAGGSSVCCLMASPRASGLFHAAIAQSPPAEAIFTRAEAQTTLQELLKVLDIPEASFDDFTAVDWQDIIKVQADISAVIAHKMPGNMPFQPVIDDDILPDIPSRVIRRGDGNAVPMIIGTNQDEATLFALPFMPPLVPTAPEDVEQFLAQRHPGRAAAIHAAYDGHGRFGSDKAIGGDGMLWMPSVRFAEALADHAPVWFYRFRWTTWPLKLARLGTPHALDLPFVFGHFPALGKALVHGADRKTASEISAEFQARWLGLAKDRTPDAGKMHWPRYDTATRDMLVFDEGVAIERDVDGVQRQAWTL